MVPFVDTEVAAESRLVLGLADVVADRPVVGWTEQTPNLQFS